MKRIYFITTLLFLFILTTAAYAQERADGLGDGAKDKDPNGIISGRPGGRAGGSSFDQPASRNAWFNKNNEQFRNAGQTHVQTLPGVTDFGVKFGVNFQELIKSPFAPQYTPGLVGGLYARRFWRVTGMKMELLASSAHYTVSGSASPQSKFSTLYFSIPAMFQLKLFQQIYFEVGPQYSYLLSSKDKNGDFTREYKQSNIFFKSEFSGFVGLDAKLPYHLRANLRYIRGLTDVNNNVYPKAYFAWTINSIQATLSYRLF